MDFWEPWIGLPHEFGADPRDGVAACCLVTAQATSENLGLPFPSSLVPDLLAMASSGQTEALEAEYLARTEGVVRPVAGDLLLLRTGQPDHPLGIGVLVSDRIMLGQIVGRGLTPLPRLFWSRQEIRRVLS
jgi:hypothetical protein